MPKGNKRCTCGATTPEQHLEAVLAGYTMHPYSGPSTPNPPKRERPAKQ